MQNSKEQLQEKYNFSTEELQLMIESIPANVFYKDTQGRYQMTSHICQMLSGGDENFSIAGKTDLDLQPDQELGRRFYQEDLEVVRTGNSLKYLQEMEFSGVKYYYEISKAPVRNAKGTIIGLMGIIIDMTEMVRAQQQLRESEDTIEASCRFAGVWTWNYDIQNNICYPGKKLQEDFQVSDKIEIVQRNV